MVRVMTSDDYAALDLHDTTYYFGYEFDERRGEKDGDEDREEWGFFVKRGGAMLHRIAYTEMQQILLRNCPDRFSTAECLLAGIGIYLTRIEPE